MISHLLRFCAFAGLLLISLTAAFAQEETPQQEQQALTRSNTAQKEPTIRSITILVRDIFEDPNNIIYRWANDLKFSTREETIRQELLFEEGDPYDPFVIAESERLLRRLRILRNASIRTIPAGDEVDIVVDTQDTWTLIPQVNFSSGDGRDRVSVGLSEGDLLGRAERIEVIYEEDEGRESISGVYDDRRVLGSEYELLAGAFDRNDGERYVLKTGKPFRTLLDRSAHSFASDYSDTVGRLFENGDEQFIYRQEIVDLGLNYSIARGIPEIERKRFTFGYQYFDKDITQADLSDYDDLNLDPDLVSNDAAFLAEDRRFSGPVFSYERVIPEFISMNYIDRFSRVVDYNLGNSDSLSAFVAPDFAGSYEDALILTGHHSHGIQFNRDRFLRGEAGFSTRIVDDAIENSLMRFELRYFDVLGPKFWGQFYLGKHTLAGAFNIDYGDDLDRDRQLLIGGDNAVRGYEARTFEGDKRFSLNLEDRFHVVENAFDLLSFGGALFFDGGAATRESFGEMFSDDFYSDIGVGLRVGFPRSSGERVLRIDVAFPLRDGPDGSGEFEPRVIFSGGQLFSSFLSTERLGAHRASVGVGFDR